MEYYLVQETTAKVHAHPQHQVFYHLQSTQEHMTSTAKKCWKLHFVLVKTTPVRLYSLKNKAMDINNPL